MSPQQLTCLGIWALVASGCASGAALAAPAMTPADGDFDGLSDRVDPCPRLAEDGLAPKPGDGCPDPDPDADGLKGAGDACPFEAETLNSYFDADGCPDNPTVDDVGGLRLHLDRVSFLKDRAALTPKARRELEELARSLTEREGQWALDVAVYEAPGRGSWLALALSSARAEEVRRVFVEQGLSPSAVTATGFGSYCASHAGFAPDAPRVDIHVARPEIRQAPMVGCEASRQAGTIHQISASAGDAAPAGP